MTTWLEQGLRNGRLLQHQVEATADFSAGHFEEEEEDKEKEEEDDEEEEEEEVDVDKRRRKRWCL